VDSLYAKALANFLRKLVITSLLLFFPAGSLDWWEAWVFLIVFFIPQLLIIIYLLRKAPDLAERRLKGGPWSEQRTSQKVIMSLVSLAFSLLVIVPGYDHRFNWSHVPESFVMAADVIVLLGFLIQFYVFKENRFASALIEVAAKQKVIFTGPYAVVRHPLYSGALLVDCFIPIALGSWWGVPFVFVIGAMLVLRLLDEEKLLHQSLPGYEEYCQKVRYRLVPHLW
jgi:protein-S-isoprenylcysteine O-methyltransferase Ste14